ncbi:MAG: hypothetical protein Q9M94_07530 [Candidatus Gracilibacteria bacterium]|nr:hypothetical protein [Candidatus Gracilibacteria bacterium]MDQ7023148.1 hypothetical protein [Candidatus Gracilibacteria bacterium]
MSVSINYSETIIEDLEDFYELYSELLLKNKELFNEKLINILNYKDNLIKKDFGLVAGNKQFIELVKKDNILSVEKIIARGYGKEVMFLILNYAIQNNIDLIKLKAQPLLLEKDENFNERLKYLYDFYGYFGFLKIGLNGDMQVDFNSYNKETLQILYNRLLLFILEKQTI